MSRPKIVFWGSPDFAVSALAACKEHSEILGVVTQPDKARGRGHELLPTPVKAWAQKENIKVFSPKSLRKLDEEGEATVAFLQQSKADYFVVVAYGNLLPDSILAIPLKAPVNIHASLLPRWRGAAPIQRALEMGDEVTGVSLQRMVKELDAGDVYLEKKYQILDEDNSETLFEKLSYLGAELITDFLKADFSTLHATQQDIAKITHAAKIDKKEAMWTPAWKAAEFHNKVRAFYSWPTVKITFSNDKNKVEVKVLKTKRMPQKANGLWGVNDGLAFVRGADDNYTQVQTLQVPGKGPTEATAVFQRMQKEGYQLIS